MFDKGEILRGPSKISGRQHKPSSMADAIKLSLRTRGHTTLQVVDIQLVIFAYRIENPGIVSGYGWLVPCWAGGS